MTRWYTSDLHFSHRNVIDYCHRPYKDIEEMDAAIIKQWNSQVKPEDEVYVLGDFGISKRKCLDEKLVSSLNGKKYMILGNHDTGFARLHKGKNTDSIRNQYKKSGWESVSTRGTIILNNGQGCVLSHLPSGSAEDGRYSEFKLNNIRKDLYHLHGHLHGHYRKKGRSIDVCFDAELKLLSEDDIINIIEDERDFIPTRLTEVYNMKTHPNLKQYEDQVKLKYLRKAVSGDLVLYNYTDKCTFDKAWNKTTLSARGLIFNNTTGEVVARPFPKFFNLSELKSTQQKAIIRGKGVYSEFHCYEKMDGSLGIIFHDGNRWRVATRGSFDSEQAKVAEEMLQEYDLKDQYKNQTILVEIIYPENKIVTDYGDARELVLLDMINTETGEGVNDPNDLDILATSLGMSCAKFYEHTMEEMLELQKTLPKDEEGFVVRFKNGFRVKIKGHEYLRIHKIISQLSPLSLWNSMKDGEVNTEYLQELPEEFRGEMDYYRDELENRYDKILTEIKWSVDLMIKTIGFGCAQTSEYRKQIGLYLQGGNHLHENAIFPFMLGRADALNKYIMNIIKPIGNKL